MAPRETRPFDAADHIDNPEAAAAYLADALLDEDPNEFLHALRVVARSKGMRQIAGESELSRPALYRALEIGGRPDFGTVLELLRSFGLKLNVQA